MLLLSIVIGAWTQEKQVTSGRVLPIGFLGFLALYREAPAAKLKAVLGKAMDQALWTSFSQFYTNMTRVKRGFTRRKRRQKKLKIVKGFRGASSLLFRNANQQYLKAYQAAFFHRRLRKRHFRGIWISRINAKVRQFGLNYCSFVYKNPNFNRKIFAQLALHDSSFTNFLI